MLWLVVLPGFERYNNLIQSLIYVFLKFTLKFKILLVMKFNRVDLVFSGRKMFAELRQPGVCLFSERSLLFGAASF